MTQLPNDSQSQEIGRLAQRALSTKIPRAWIETPMSGDSDYGIDYQIQLKNPQGQVEFSFYLQLKGTTNPSFNSDGTLSFAFRCSTLNFYHSQEPLVMVAVVNLKDKMDEVYNCPIYYLWLDDEWFKIYEEKLKTQESITLRIPIGQLLTAKLDVYNFYRNRFQERMALTDLSREIKPHTEDIIETISHIKNTITDKPFFLKAIEHSGDEPWIENPEGYYPTELKRIEIHQNNNRLSSARRIIEDLERNLDSMDSHEIAELWYQKANLMLLLDKSEESLGLYKDAKNLSGKIRYVVAYLEAILRFQPSHQARNILTSLEGYPNNDKRIVFLKAKCMALIGCAKEAIVLICDNHPDYIAAKLIVYTIIDDKVQLDSLIDTIDIESLKSVREKFFIHFLAGRRAYLKANNEVIQYDEIIPISGLPDADLILMQKSYRHYRQAWDLTEELGYPQDFTLLLDISPLVFTYFNNMQGLFRHFDNILKERPEHSEVIHVYSRLVFNNQDYKKAIILLRNKKCELELNDQVLLFLSYYNIKKYPEAFDVFKDIADEVLNSKINNKFSLFYVASRVAKELFEVDASEYYMSRVKMFPDADAVIALSEFIDSTEKDKPNIDLSLDMLYRKYIELGRPLFLAEQLINNLQVNTSEDADKFIDVATTITKHHELSEYDNFHYANSLITKCDYERALVIINKSLQKEHIDPNWHLLKALALHNNGEPGLAIDCIGKVLQNTQLSHDTLKMYIQLCIQFGMANEVEKTIIEVISKCNDASIKVKFLIQLFNIYSKDEENKDKRLPVLRQIGKHVNQDDCDEEGSFLMLMLTSQRTDDELQFAEWQQRLINYTKKFPDSARLKRAEINPDAPAEELLETLNKLVGVTPEKIQWWENNKLQIRNGSLRVPFAMRGYFLKDTRDIFTTWSLSKFTSEESLEFKIRHAGFSPQPDFDTLVDDASTFIFEETTLLILSELNILDHFFSKLKRFALLSTSFKNISTHAHSYIKSDASNVAEKIMSAINNHRNKLKLLDCHGKNIIDDYTSAVIDKGYVLLSDDIDMQSFVLAATTKKISANSVNVILFLMKCDILTQGDAYDLIAKLCDLGISQPNMSIQLLSDIYYYYFLQCGGGNIFSTNFTKVYDRIFSSLHTTTNAASVLIHMLVNASAFEKPLPTPNVLQILLRTLIERNPFTSLDRFVTIWFIQQCTFSLSENAEDISVHSSELSVKIFGLYKEVMCDIDPAYDDEDKIISSIIDSLKSVDKEKRSQIFTAVQRCFKPLTHSALTLQSKYQSMKFNDQYFF
ncbi:TPA: DUF4365 domain-containing protein [Klebsiella pneumoniae]|nr:DUF4365 domain-containing protein [Klebsiella pneumoniae]